MLNVHLRITDATTRRPTPVRVRVTGPDGTHYAPLGHATEFPCGRNEDVGGHVKLGRERWWYIDGACEMPLPAGVPLRVQVTKGPEWAPVDETVTLGSGQISLRFAIQRWTDSHVDGWMSIDTRCHFITPHAALLEAQAEGLNVANLLATPFPVLALDANTYTTTPNLLAFSGQVSALEAAGTAVVVNTFNTHPVLGKVALLNSHRPVFPLTFGGEESDDWGICDWCDQCHRKKGLVVWVDAFEPTGGLIGGEALVAAILGKIDAIEVTNEPRKTPLLPWVYRLWDAGVLLLLVGASAKESNRATLGNMRTYAERRHPSIPVTVGGEPGALATGWKTEEAISPPIGPESEPKGARVGHINPHPVANAPGSPPIATGMVNGRASSPSWIDAIRAGQNFVTSGPFLVFTRENNHFRAEVRSGNRLLPVEIVANGQVIAAGAGAIETTVAEPGWIAARCSAQGEFAHTSPVAIDSPARKTEAISTLRRLIEQTREWAETHGRYANPKRKQAILDRCEEAIRKLEGAL